MTVDVVHRCREVIVVQQHDAIAVLVDVVHAGVRIEAAMAHIEDVDRLRELVAEDPAKAWLR